MADEPIESNPSEPETAPSTFDQHSDSAHEAAEETSEQSEQTDLIRADEHRRERGETEDPYEGAVPPGYDWPTHGGYLGCLLSLMASCVIGGFIGTTLFAALSVGQIVPQFVAILLTIVVYAIVTVGLGRLGWVLGKRFYREYPQERYPVWGEDDVEDEEPLPQTIITLAEEQPDEASPDEAKLSSAANTNSAANTDNATSATEADISK